MDISARSLLNTPRLRPEVSSRDEHRIEECLPVTAAAEVHHKHDGRGNEGSVLKDAAVTW